ncbi:MAG TPA: MmcQ/YjbR family DNA-binding protein [Leeuwenhoekiella sp.]|nr:MmcQ/YjbR family DNA-binding protein [Leeuwenhoekiella sp.]
MNIEELRTFCLLKPGVTEELPFDNDTLVFKVMGKIFVLTSLAHWETGEPSINVKCDPKEALKLREKYPQVIPGYHMSKKHWNTVHINTGFPDQKILHFINHSYDLVVSKLTKKLRDQLQNEN